MTLTPTPGEPPLGPQLPPRAPRPVRDAGCYSDGRVRASPPRLRCPPPRRWRQRRRRATWSGWWTPSPAFCGGPPGPSPSWSSWSRSARVSGWSGPASPGRRRRRGLRGSPGPSAERPVPRCSRLQAGRGLGPTGPGSPCAAAGSAPRFCAGSGRLAQQAGVGGGRRSVGFAAAEGPAGFAQPLSALCHRF